MVLSLDRAAAVADFMFACALVVVAPQSGLAQIPPARGPVVAAAPTPPTRILGVFDETSGDPMVGAEVMDMLTGTSALTTATGTVSLSFLAPGGSLVRVRKVGYAVQTMMVQLSPSDTAPITIVLKRITELPAVVTRDSAPHYLSSRLRQFEERRAGATSGYFIDEKTLRKEDGRPLGNVLLSRAPGVQVKQLSGSAMFLLRSPRCSNGGQPDVYLDGVAVPHLPDIRWPGSTRTRNQSDTRDIPIDLSQFQVSELAGVEYYPDNALIPAQFSRTAAGCGALMLWTRER